MSDATLRVGFGVWPHGTLAALVARNEVVVCSASLAADQGAVSHALTVLDATERERFERYENADVARRFAVGRLRLREMLGALLAIPPRAVPIQIGLHGKPALARGLQSSGVRFSIAHCEDLMLAALSRIGEVGIDVERVRPLDRWARVADRVFSPTERAEIGREIASGDEPSSVLLRFWCRGEAELKAIGSGIVGLSAHRDGWHPSGMRVAELSTVPLPSELGSEGVRYQAAVALWTARETNLSRAPAETSQARTPTITPTSASTA
ncbi:MAG: 4'-phosphopantetheinyl transferase family protein [Gemmatimonadaceae bacterium]